jgi:hypothetical protein
VIEDRIDGWWNQRSTAGFTMRALVGQNKRFLVGKEKTATAQNAVADQMHKCLLTTPTQL